MKVLYKDKNVLIVEKPFGVLSEATPTDNNCVINLLYAENSEKNLFLVHRLDRNAAGVMLLARNKTAAGKLSALVADRSFTKEYLAVIHGKPFEESGVYRDLLFKDSASNKSFVTDKVRRGVKEASLEYETLETLADTEEEELSLVKVRLHTGRTHQIRVQFASRGTPLFGDGKYGSHSNRGKIALFSGRISYICPFTKKEIDITAKPEEYPFTLFKIF